MHARKQARTLACMDALTHALTEVRAHNSMHTSMHARTLARIRGNAHSGFFSQSEVFGFQI